MMRYEWEIICDRNGEENTFHLFVGTAEELNNHVREMIKCGCTNIFTNRLGADMADDGDVEEEDPFEDEYVDPWEKEYIRSVTGGDYSSANPWDAPGMSVSDFI